MTITSKPSSFVKIPYNDPRFMMTDGLVNYNIAGVEITSDCPRSIKHTIEQAMKEGWLVPFAMIKQELENRRASSRWLSV